MLIKNYFKRNQLFFKLDNQFNLSKRFMLMRKYAYLREQLDEKLRQQDDKKQLGPSNDLLLQQSKCNKLKLSNDQRNLFSDLRAQINSLSAKNLYQQIDHSICLFSPQSSQFNLSVHENVLPQQELNNYTSSIEDKLQLNLNRNLPIKNNLILNSITSFKQLKEDVYKSFLNYEEDQGIKWRRFQGLNKILKGHRPGELTIFTGPTGCGKTTFLSEYSLDLCKEGVKTLWGNFEIKNVLFLNRMLTQLAGKSLTDNLEEFSYWASEFEKLPIYFLTYHGEESFKNVIKTMEYSVKELGVNHVLIDNIQFMIGNQAISNSNNSKFDRFQYQDLVIGECRRFATKFNCHITLVIHPRKEQFNEELTNMSVFGGGKATQEADNIMILQMKWIDSNKFIKTLQITKNRFDGDLGSFQIKFDKEHKGFGELEIKLNES